MSTVFSKSTVRIVKVGGSLLDWPQLPTALTQWLDAQSRATNVLIAGGGPWADAVRRADAAFNLGEDQSHWLCIDAMGVTARLLTALLAGRATLVTNLHDVSPIAHAAGGPWIVLDVQSFLAEREPQLAGQRLSHTWDVTSDSIAARIAAAIGADELVLLKSQEPPAGQSLTELADAGFIDAFFPRAMSEFRGKLRLVNLRGVPVASPATVIS